MASPINPGDIQVLIKRFAPILVFHPEEQYLPDDAEAVLNTGKLSLQCAIIADESNYDTFPNPLIPQKTWPIASADALPSVEERAKAEPNASSPAFRRWLFIPDEFKPGNLSRAKVLVMVHHRDDTQRPGQCIVHLQYWIFYPFNGPGKFCVQVGNVVKDDVFLTTCGRHYGDWEHVTVEIESIGNDWAVRRVYLSKHSLSSWGDRSQLQWLGERPKIYVARDSHAHYGVAGRHDYQRVTHTSLGIGMLDVDLFDITGNGISWDVSDRCVLVASDYSSHQVATPRWLEFGGRWGQYERLSHLYMAPGYPYTYKEVGSGPGGPLGHGTELGSSIETGVGSTSVAGRPYAFYLCKKRLGHSLWNGTTWEQFDNGTPPGLTVEDPVGITQVAGRPYIFVRASNGNLHHCFWTNTAWSWVDNGTPGVGIAGGVGVTQIDGRPYSFVRTTDGRLRQCTWTGTTWVWFDNGVPPGVTIVGGVGATQVSGRPYAFVRTNDGRLRHCFWTGRAWAWHDNGAPPGLSVAAGIGVTQSGARPHIFVQTNDGHVWLNAWTGSAWAWTPTATPAGAIGGVGIGAISVSDRPYAFVYGKDNHLWARWWDGSAWQWTNQGSMETGILKGNMGIAIGEGARPYVFLLNSYGQVRANWWNGTAWAWSTL